VPPSRSTLIRLIAVAIVLAAAAIVGYGAFWWIAAERFQSAAIAWIEARRAEGYAVGYRAMERDGFPGMLRLAFHDPSLASPAEAPRWSWSGARATAEIRPWAPLHVALRAEGPQTFLVPGPGGPLTYAGSAGTLTASITSDRSLPLREMTVRDLILTGQGSSDVVAIPLLDLSLRHNADGAEPDMDDGYDLSVRASDLRLPARLRLPLGEHVSHVELDAAVIGGLRSRPWPGALFQWRDAGGVVEISDLAVHYGPLRLTFAGTLALDGDGQPMGAFNARGEGLAETLDALDRRGFLGRSEVDGAKLALRILARPSAIGESGLNVPLTLQDQVLYAASLPLLKVPAIHWK
jgi:hypothetical protein